MLKDLKLIRYLQSYPLLDDFTCFFEGRWYSRKLVSQKLPIDELHLIISFYDRNITFDMLMDPLLNQRQKGKGSSNALKLLSRGEFLRYTKI